MISPKSLPGYSPQEAFGIFKDTWHGRTCSQRSAFRGLGPQPKRVAQPQPIDVVSSKTRRHAFQTTGGAFAGSTAAMQQFTQSKSRMCQIVKENPIIAGLETPSCSPCVQAPLATLYGLSRFFCRSAFPDQAGGSIFYVPGNAAPMGQTGDDAAIAL